MNILNISILFLFVVLSGCANQTLVEVQNLNSRCGLYLYSPTDFAVQTIYTNASSFDTLKFYYFATGSNPEAQIEIFANNISNPALYRSTVRLKTDIDFIEAGTQYVKIILHKIPVNSSQTYFIKIACINCDPQSNVLSDDGSISNSLCPMYRTDNPYPAGNYTYVSNYSYSVSSIDTDLVFIVEGEK